MVAMCSKAAALARASVESTQFGRHRKLEVTHVGIGRRVEDAAIPSHAGEDETSHVEIGQQKFKRRGVEAGVLRLQDEIIVLFRMQQLCDLFPSARIF